MTDSASKARPDESRASNDAAFDQLFRLLYNDMVRYAMTFTRDKDQACNVAQDVFIKLWQIRDQIDLEKSLKAFLFQMVRNKSLNLLRDTRREVTGLDLADLQHEDLITDPESIRVRSLTNVEQTGLSYRKASRVGGGSFLNASGRLLNSAGLKDSTTRKLLRLCRFRREP